MSLMGGVLEEFSTRMIGIDDMVSKKIPLHPMINKSRDINFPRVLRMVKMADSF